MKIAAILVLLLLTAIGSSLLYAQLSLSNIEAKIARDHPVDHRPVDEVKDLVSGKDSSNYLIFDTRPLKEFRVGHINKAIQVDPDINSDDFLSQYGEDLAGKHILFYCSVGKRSSILLERVEEAALKSGALSLANIRGGIFRWYNEGFAVVNSGGETDEIHPYDRFWGRLVNKRTPGK